MTSRLSRASLMENGVDMVVVGPEDPLVKGVYDDFKADPRTQNIPVIGPSKLAPYWKAARTSPSNS